jgi:hypothetical protein
MVLCGSSKTKKSTADNKKPATATPAPIKEEVNEPQPQPALRKQKSFYSASEDIYPIKVDFLSTHKNTAPGEPKKHRFVVLTDSVVILYDESEHPSTGHYSFETQHFLLNQVSISY